MFGWVPRTERIANVQDASVWAHQRVTQFALKDDSLRGGKMSVRLISNQTAEWGRLWNERQLGAQISSLTGASVVFGKSLGSDMLNLNTPSLKQPLRIKATPNHTEIKQNIPLDPASHAQTLRPRTYQMNFRTMVSHKCRQYSPSVSFSCATEHAEINASYVRAKSKSLIVIIAYSSAMILNSCWMVLCRSSLASIVIVIWLLLLSMRSR